MEKYGLVDRVSGLDPDESRHLSPHMVEAAAVLMYLGVLSVADFKTAINATVDDETDIDNLQALFVGEQADKIEEAIRQKAIFIIGREKINQQRIPNFSTAAEIRARLGIAPL